MNTLEIIWAIHPWPFSTPWIPVEQSITSMEEIRQFWRNIKERQKENKQIAEGKESTSIYTPCNRCQSEETGRKVPNSERGNNNIKRKIQKNEKKRSTCGYHYLNAICCLLFSLSAYYPWTKYGVLCSLASIESRNTEYWELSPIYCVICSIASILSRNTLFEQYRHAQRPIMGSTSSTKRAEIHSTPKYQ